MSKKKHKANGPKAKGKKKAAADRQSQPGSVAYAKGLLSQSFEAYRLARRDRPRNEYQPFGYSGDSAIIGSHDLMHRRVRDLVRNTALAKNIVGSIVDLVVGPGMQTYSWPFAPAELLKIVTELESLSSGALGPRLTYALESDDLYEEYCSDPDQFDVEGRMSGPEVQRMLMAESATVGNGLLIRTFVRDYKLVPLAWQLIEREQLDDSQDRPASPGQNRIVGGVETDAANRTVAYHIYVDHPQEMFGVGQSALLGAGATLSLGSRRLRIPAERVIDLALFHRPSASLGVSWLDACGQSLWDRDSYMGSEIQAAAVDAVFAFVAKLKDAEQSGGLGFDDGEDDDDGFGNRQYKIGRSPVASTIGVDESLEMVRPTRPNKDAPAFIRLVDRDIAAATPIDYYTLTGDWEATNFSSGRGSKLSEDLKIQPLQNWFACHVALRIRKEFNTLAAASGLIESITPAEFRKNQRTYQRFDAIANGRDLMDPYREGEARTTRLRTGMSTFKEECARSNKHWIRVLMQLAIERKVSKVFGVTLDFSKQGGSGGDSASSSGDIVGSQDEEDSTSGGSRQTNQEDDGQTADRSTHVHTS
jgi:lambda family phage portal protein